MSTKHTFSILSQTNWLQHLELLLQLRYELATSSIRGGHAPFYLARRQRRRLVENKQLLTPQALEKLATELPLFSN